MTKENFKIEFTKSSRVEGVEPFDVAAIAVDFDCEFISIEGRDVPAESIKYLIGYGIKQTLADSYAQLVTKDKAREAFDKKLDGIFEGMTFNENGNRGDPVAVEMRKLAEIAILGSKTRGAWIKANGENAEKLLNARIKKVLESNADKLRARATELVEQRRAVADMGLDLSDDESEGEQPAEPPVELIKGKRGKAA